MTDINDIRLIAMYLPQYHPIPENDRWWGEGFTEWTNVRKAQPRFPGHYQPHVPGQLGYYDLREAKVRSEQAELARVHGLHGFCYYHYWFNGKRLLETPFNEVLQSKEPDFPFCLCWANENWTRSWDGAGQEILIAQDYSDADSLAFINELLPAFRDERYIRVNGKPLLLVYRTSLLPNPKRTTQIWREAVQKAGLGDLYLVRVENNIDGQEPCPSDVGFDAAMEFAPFWRSIGRGIHNLAEVGQPSHLLDADIVAVDYDTCMRNMLFRPLPEYKFFRGLFPMWDNSARRKKNPLVVLNSSPEKYQFWLAALVRQTLQNCEGDERLIFVNAWNEWGEGCHLEPDEKYGMAYLEATRTVLTQAAAQEQHLFNRISCDEREGGGLDPATAEPSAVQLKNPETFPQRDALVTSLLEQVKTLENEKQCLLTREAQLVQQLHFCEEDIKFKALYLQYKDEAFNNLRDSLSWRVTRPLRTAHAFCMRTLLSLDIGRRFASSPLLRRMFHLMRDIINAREGRAVSAPSLLPEEESAGAEQLLADVLARKGSLFDVLVFPVIDWHFRLQRPQQLAKSLAAEGHRTFYLTTDFIVSDAPGFQIVESPADNVFIVRLVCSARCSLNIHQDVINREQRQMLVASLLSLFHECAVSDAVSLVDLPFWQAVATALPGNLVVYDCMDHHAGFSTNSRRMLKEEQQLLTSADLVITTSERVSQNVAKKVANIIIRNGAEVDFFAARPPALLLPRDKPIIGYYGFISEWFDLELVISAARACPEWQFVLVGATDGCETRDARKLPNITFIGEVPYESLPGYLHAFDVCIIPFKVTELTRCTNPVKVYEYLSAGKPVVATALPELQLLGELVHCAASTPQFITALHLALQESSDQELADRRAGWAQKHDWRERTRQLAQSLRTLFPKVSVVVLTYNNLELTKECLASLLAESVYPEWELIIVDNASIDGSQEYLTEFAQLNPQTKLLLNEQNMGFAGGNNVGLNVATGEYLVILNNDTRVTPGWLTDLVRHLRRDERLGLIGPVTNSIGNEAQIAIAYHKIEEMRSKAASYTSRRPRRRIDVETVAFFCVALRRSTWAKVGPLDEAFTVGFFEDDDYCRRVAQAGLKVAIAEDVFIHHQHSASFNTLPPGERQAIFDRNKQLFEAKWGKWVPHAYRSK